MRALPILSLAIIALTAPARADVPSPRQCVSANETAGKLSDEQKLRAARDKLLVCASPSCPREVRAECTHQIDEINAHLPTVVFSVKTTTGQDASTVRVTMDGELIADHLDGAAIAVDPGTHELAFEVPGEPAVRRTFVFHEGDSQRHEAIVLGHAAAEPAALSPEPAPQVGHTQRVLGVVGASAGVLGLSLGTILGAFASSAWSKAKSECPAEAACPAQAVSDSMKVSTYATASTVGFIAGGALLAGGITVFVLAPKDANAKVTVAMTSREAIVRGMF